MKAGNLIYLDYQASTPLDPRVQAVMAECDQSVFANPHAVQHLLGQQSAEIVASARADIEACINAAPEEVIFTSGATEANNQAIASLMFANNTRRNKILISAIEHKCIKNAAYYFGQKLGYTIEEIPVLESGLIDMQAYQAMLSDDVLLVCVMAVNNEIGTIQNIPEIAGLAHQHGAMLHCDAAQAPEAMAIDVRAWQVDMLSLSGHKIYGPKGIGALYIRNDLQARLPPLIHGGGQQFGMRSGTLPTALCAGLAEAMKLSHQQVPQSRADLAALRDTFIAELADHQIDFSINGHTELRHPGNINIRFNGKDATKILAALQSDICASTGSACNSDMVLSSHVLQAIGLSAEQAKSSIRFSLGRYSDAEQVGQSVELLTKCLQRL